jgi:hypothetical protein
MKVPIGLRWAPFVIALATFASLATARAELALLATPLALEICPEPATASTIPLLIAQSGCCSFHDGVCGCSSTGRTLCCDGTLSPTCTCTPPPPTHTLTLTAGPLGAPNPVASEGGVSLTVTAVDSLSHALSYSWSGTCSGLPSNGAFNSFTSRTPTWTAPTNTTGSQRICTIQVSVSDGQGLTQVASYTQTVNPTALNPPPPSTVQIDLSGTQFEVRASDTIRIRNVTVAGYLGKYWADLRWNGTAVTFQPIAAGQETSPAFYDKTELLKGKWHFVFTIISTFTHDYTLTTIPGTTNSQGGYWINGTSQYGLPVVAAYWPTDKNWTLLDPGTNIDEYFTFYTDGATILPNSCYRQISHPSGNLSACYALTGSRTGPADAPIAADPGAKFAGEVARELDVRLQAPAEATPPAPAVMEKYWIMKGLIGR